MKSKSPGTKHYHGKAHSTAHGVGASRFFFGRPVLMHCRRSDELERHIVELLAGASSIVLEEYVALFGYH